MTDVSAVHESSTGLEVRGLQVYVSGGRLLVTVENARFRSGVTALIGPNGSGKSTLLRTLAALHEAFTGTMILNSVNAAANRRAYLEQLVYMPQNFATYPELTGQEFLEYSLRLRGARPKEARSMAAAWLETVGLSHAARAKTGSYSQGMRQRLGFAYAMQLDVKLYLLDEPFAGVDPESRGVLMDLLFRLAGDRTVIASTHHVDEAAARGAAIARIASGALVTQC